MSEIEYEVQMVMDHVEDEAKAERETADLIEAVNTAVERFRRHEESARIASRLSAALDADKRKQKKQKALARKHRRRKWKAVKRCANILMGVAAVFGFEILLGLPHGLSLGCMVLLMILAAYIATVQVVPEVLWYLRHKEVRAR